MLHNLRRLLYTMTFILLIRVATPQVLAFQLVRQGGDVHPHFLLTINIPTGLQIPFQDGRDPRASFMRYLQPNRRLFFGWLTYCGQFLQAR